ncbi:hypothetical protein [Streptomyces sp. NRRL S-646]|uniref:hypothetical protein n=1 Tax=Streptomyces sp. NRRL S-646 TaxID=1463917 RepID=UPI0004C86A38|nr:hypothetical protein [Streptomyces sp. NRRL S-646]
MPRDLDELRATNDRLLRILDAGARERLMALPDTVHVSVGIREVGDGITDEFVFKVYVAKKLPAEQLTPQRLVPGVVDGVRTDVCEVLGGVTCVDVAPVVEALAAAVDRPLIGGTAICNGFLGKDEQHPNNANPVLSKGTLGMIVGRLGDRKPCILTNAHVVAAYGLGTPGTVVYQPEPVDAHYPGGPLPWKPTSAGNDVATVAEALLTVKIDAAIAQVIPPSSCCSSSGAKYSLLIKELNVDKTAGGITGSMPPVADLEVVKVGIKTGRVEGTIVDADAPFAIKLPGTGERWDFIGQLKIRGHVDVKPNEDPKLAAPRLFADHGDSGSVVVDMKTRRVVGLLHAREEPNPPLPPDTPVPPTLLGVASNITDVIDTLGIYFADSSDAPGVTGGFSDASADAFVDAPELQPWLTVPALEPLTRHAREIVHLVRRDRRALVAWHRAQGPAWAAAFARSARVPEYRLPAAIQGVGRAEALSSLRTALVERGSPELAAAFADAPPALFTALATCDSVGQLGALLDQQPT